MSDLRPGDEFAGWRIERPLARGGMGVLYLARHPRLPRTDVLKVLPEFLAREPRFRERFLREAARVSALSHPHIVVVHDSGEHGGVLYLVMQFVRGGDLRAQLTSGPLPPDRSVTLAEQIASALDAAHRHGVVHRDVKPENVLLAESGPGEPDHALLTDFGISRDEADASTLTATGELLLTPAYAAPEQVSGGPVDARADQYALACMVYEFLTGHPPYRHPGGLAMLAAHLHEPLPSLPVELDLPPGLEAVLHRGLAKDRTERFFSCREFAAALRGAVPAGTPTAGRWPSGGFGPGSSDAWPTPMPTPVTGPPHAEPASVRLRTPPPSVTAEPPTQLTPLIGPQQAAAFRGQPPERTGGSAAPRRSRRPLVLGLVTLVVAGGAAAGIAVTTGAFGGASKGSTGGSSGPDAFAALRNRIPAPIRDGCRQSPPPPDADPFVAARATCSATRDGRRFVLTYDAISGDHDKATTYRREVLGLGGANHAPGDCRTRTRDPAFASRPARVGLGTSAAPPLNIDVWCDFSGTMHLLLASPAPPIVALMQRVGDDGDVAAQPQRYDDLVWAKPS